MEVKVGNDKYDKFVGRLGFTSRTQDGFHVSLLDCDYVRDYQMLKDAVVYLQDLFDLSDYYVIATKTGYHIICLDRLTFYEALSIYDKFVQIGYGDRKHYEIGAKRSKWTLAIDEDKRKFDIVRSVRGARRKSNAHRLLLNTLYDFEIEKDSKFDDFTTLEFEIFNKKIKEVKQCQDRIRTLLKE